MLQLQLYCLLDTTKSLPLQVYMCVADGVGSWRQYGVDPREYSHRLVENARKVIEADVLHRELIGDSPFDRGMRPLWFELGLMMTSHACI